MKKLNNVFLFIFAFLCILPACGEKKEEIKLPELPEGDYAVIAGLEEIAAPAETEIYEETVPLPISWGYNKIHVAERIPSIEHTIRVSNGMVFNYINEKFNVSLSGYLYDPAARINIRKGPPEVYPSNPYSAYLSEESRTIPREMIERYAPDYAALLDTHNAWNVNLAENGEYLGISSFNIYNEQIPLFSVYRLDWLEELNIQPKGNPVRLDDGVYFTEEAFSIGEFRQIINRFTRDQEGRQQYGIAVEFLMGARQVNPFLPEDFAGNVTGGAAVDYNNIGAILGMFGINAEVIEENGKAVPFYVTDRYKDALSFLYELAQDGSYFYSGTEGAVSTYQGFTSGYMGSFAGWVCMPPEDIFSAFNALRNHVFGKESKILITPPEIGAGGNRGFGVAKSSNVFTPEHSWVINKSVDDEKLARILQILNALSFDPETFVISKYGFESRHFDWEGEAYNSAIIPIPQRLGTNREPVYEGGQLFVTDIIDGKAGRQIYSRGYKYLYDYAQSSAGKSLVTYNYRQDVWGRHASVKADLDLNYGDTMKWQAREFMAYAAFGWDTSEYWSEYMAFMEEFGLGHYIDFYNMP